MSVTTTGGDLQDLARVDQPGFYDVRNAPLLARLRQEAPVFYYAELGTWVLSKYHDVKYASKTPELFSVRKGILLNDARYGESIADSFFPEGAELISTLDPPRHGEVRRTIAPAFTPRAIAALEDPVRAVCRRILDGFEAGRPVEFIHAAARVVPIQAVARLLGVPPAKSMLTRSSSGPTRCSKWALRCPEKNSSRPRRTPPRWVSSSRACSRARRRARAVRT